MELSKVSARKRRHNRIRAKGLGTAKKPRLVVSKSLTHNYAQLIDDTTYKVMASSSDMKAKSKGTKTERAKQVGRDIAAKALEKNISEVVFDRNGNKYHGRVKALAEGAREGGLKF